MQGKKLVFDPWVGKIPGRSKWQPTPIFLPGKFHGQRNLATVHGVSKSQTWLSNYHSLGCISGSPCCTPEGDRSDQMSSLSCVRLFATPWIAACQASLSITNSRSSLRLTSIESVKGTGHCKWTVGCWCICVLSCVRLCDPVDCSPPGSSVHGIFQAKILYSSIKLTINNGKIKCRIYHLNHFLKDFFMDHFYSGPFLLNLLQYCFSFMFWFFGPKVCVILAPWQGIGLTLQALEGEVLTTGPGKSPS